MGKLENIQYKINQYLKNKGLPHINQQVTTIYMLFELTLRSVWTIEDTEQRDSLAVEIAQALKPYFGGKKIEDALYDITEKMKKEEKQEEIQEKIQEEKDKLEDLKERMKDPNYVPTFDELMKIKKEQAGN
ncbi:MAG: hypothetical protein JXB88_01745 [Spirochaetales bacterium]|nr:hypothetical protein [Spirochaetales bacterium]